MKNNRKNKIDKDLSQDYEETYQDFLIDLMERFSSKNNSLAKFDLTKKESAKKALGTLNNKIEELEQFKKEAKSLKKLLQEKRFELENK